MALPNGIESTRNNSLFEIGEELDAICTAFDKAVETKGVSDETTAQAPS